MAADNRVDQFVLETQVGIFRDARRDLQLPLKVIAADSGIPYPTVVAYAEGRHAMPISALKRLLTVGGMAPLLSRLFDPEDFELVGASSQTNHDDFAAKCIALVTETAAAHHPESEAAEKIGPNECKALRGKRTQLRAVA